MSAIDRALEIASYPIALLTGWIWIAGLLAIFRQKFQRIAWPYVMLGYALACVGIFAACFFYVLVTR